MLEGRASVHDTDMPMKMQIHAMNSASHALDLYDVLDCKSIAAHIKKELDGSVLWVPISVVSSLILRAPSSTSAWRPSGS